MIKNEKGFMLLETLIVTAFVSVVLIYLFIQVSNITSNYSENLSYNTVDDLYALDDLKNYIMNEPLMINYVNNELLDDFIVVDQCNSSLFTDVDYCQSLLDKLKVNEFIISKNNLENIDFSSLENTALRNFISSLDSSDSNEYRLIAVIDKDRYASLIFDLGSE